MRKAVTDGTVYDDLDAWAKSQVMDADAAIEAAVDAFYQTNLADERLLDFFDGVDMVGLRKHQFNFMRYAFSDGRVGRYTGKSIYNGHKRLIEEKGLTTTHFDYVAGNLVSTLSGLNVPQPIIDRVVDTVGPLRQIFDEATQEQATKE